MSTTNTTTRRGTAAWNDRLAEGAKNLTRAERRALAACAKGGGRKALRAFERALYRAGSSRVATAKGPRS
jgi:hypothetical protein